MISRVCCLLSLLLLTHPLQSQDEISVDAVATMHVCNSNNPADAGPCAMPPKLLSKISPAYPDKARQNRKEGTVTLGLIVTKEGAAKDVHVIKGVDKDIDRAAVDAVNQWKFDPGTYQGGAVDVEMTVTVNFHLSGNLQQASPTGNLLQQNKSADDARNLYSDAAEAYNRADYGTAANLFRKVTVILPQNGNAWNDLGRALLALNQLDAAAEALKTSIEKDPASRNAYNNLGLVYSRQRKYDEAAAQFRKQMVVNPDDHYAHRNLGVMLRDQHLCGEAMPELEKALSLTPNHPETLLAEGDCDLQLGNRAKGISELQQATSISSAPGVFNTAAYALAKQNIETKLAAKWSETSITMENTHLQNIPLGHPTPEQLNYVLSMASYWDTRGWIYFLEGDNNSARSFVEAAWSVRTSPTIGYHLGRIYEATGRSRDAVRAYAMAVACADQSTRGRIDLRDIADAKKQLTELTDENPEILVKHAHEDLGEKNVVSIPNTSGVNGSANFAVVIATSEKTPEVRQLDGDKTFEKFAETVRHVKLPISIPDSSTVELPLRAVLTCHPGQAQCRFAFLNQEEAVNLARDEMAASSFTAITSAERDPHVYNDPALGMRISLPDQWSLLRTEPGSFSKPRNVMFTKPGSAAMFMLTRERFEGSLELYQKMLDRFFSTKSEFKRAGEETVKRDGLTGSRWNVSWNENGIAYSSVIEMFGVGDDYYRITTLAPKEVYDRYSVTFEDMLRSVQFPMLRADSPLLDPAK